MRDFLGLPLIGWSIRFAQKISRFDKIVVSTDSEEIAAVSRSEGVDVPNLRPSELASDTATSADVVLHALNQEKHCNRSYDLVALLQPTSPVREPSRWDKAFAHFDHGDCDAVIGVAPAHRHPWHAFHWEEGGKLRPFSEQAVVGLRTQDLPPAVYVAGNMYLIHTAVLQRDHSFFPRRTVGVLCDQPCEALDIDTEADWITAEALARHYGKCP